MNTTNTGRRSMRLSPRCCSRRRHELPWCLVRLTLSKALRLHAPDMSPGLLPVQYPALKPIRLTHRITIVGIRWSDLRDHASLQLQWTERFKSQSQDVPNESFAPLMISSHLGFSLLPLSQPSCSLHLCAASFAVRLPQKTSEAQTIPNYMVPTTCT